MRKAILVLAAIVGHAVGQVEPIDFNRNGIIQESQDVADFLSVYSGGGCSTGDCQSIDYNGDGLFPDSADFDQFLADFNDYGWTKLPPLPPGAAVYYLADWGSESNTGLTPDSPKRRWQSVWSMVRDRVGDRICLVGDLTLNETNGASMYHKSGASADAPIIVYSDKLDGTPAIVTRVGSGAAFYLGGAVVEHVWFMNLDVRGVNASYGLQSYVTGGGWRIEGCSFTGFSTGVNLNGSVTGVDFYRSVFADNSSSGSHSQGVYIEGVIDCEFLQCVWDNNGRRNGFGTMFNHNLYVNAKCSNVRVIDSITARASATGLQLRWNYMEAIGNVAIWCPLGITLGHESEAATYPEKHVSGRVVGNLVYGTADINPTEQRGGPALSFGLGKNIVMSDNTIVHAPNAREPAIKTSRPSTNVLVFNNSVSGWRGLPFAAVGQASPLDPTVVVEVPEQAGVYPTIEDYMAERGEVHTSPEAFIELAKKNRKGTWRSDWTAPSLIRFITAQ